MTFTQTLMTNKIRNIETGQEATLSSLRATWAETAAGMPLQMLLPGSLPKLSPCWMYFKELLSQIEQERNSLLAMLRSDPEGGTSATGCKNTEGRGRGPSSRRCSEQGSCTAVGGDDDEVPMLSGQGPGDAGEAEAEAPLTDVDGSEVSETGNSYAIGPAARPAAVCPPEANVEVTSSSSSLPKPQPAQSHLPNSSWTTHSNLSYGSSSSLSTTASSHGDSESSSPVRLSVNEIVHRLEKLFEREVQLR